MFKSSLEMCWNIKVNLADPLQYRHRPLVENPCAKVLQLLCLGWLLTNESYMDMKSSLPARGNPNGFLVHRLNHSATKTWNISR